MPEPSNQTFDFTETELVGFSLSPDLSDAVGESELIITDLSSRKKLRMDTYVREMAVFEGAIKQMQTFREHLINRAKQRYVEMQRPGKAVRKRIRSS